MDCENGKLSIVSERASDAQAVRKARYHQRNTVMRPLVLLQLNHYITPSFYPLGFSEV